MAYPTPVPGSQGSDPLITLWQDLSMAIASGDAQQIQNVIQDVMMLTPTEKQYLEDLASVIPYPGIQANLISQIFSNPEATIGIIERLGPQAMTSELNLLLGMVENAITFSAILEYLQSDAKLAQDVKTQTLTGTSNPINVALNSFVQSGSLKGITFNGSSLQFLQDNPILLSALKTADPALLTQAYQIASGQLALSLYSQLGTASPSDTPQPLTPAQELYRSILYAIEHDQLEMNQGVVMLMQFLVTIQASQGTLAINMPNKGAIDMAIQAKMATAASQAASSLLPSATIVTSWISAANEVFQSASIQVPPQTINQLALLLVAAQQMAVYWQIPGAVSLMQAGMGQVTEKSMNEASVRSFAIAIGVFVNSADFENILTVAIKQSCPNLTAEQLALVISAVKITFLIPALVALYITMLRKTQGQFSAQELKDMLLGKIPIPTDDPLLEGIMKSIQAELQQIPEEKRDEFLSNLLASYNENSDLGELIDPSNSFLRLCDPTYFLDQTSAEPV